MFTAQFHCMLFKNNEIPKCLLCKKLWGNSLYCLYRFLIDPELSCLTFKGHKKNQKTAFNYTQSVGYIWYLCHIPLTETSKSQRMTLERKSDQVLYGTLWGSRLILSFHVLCNEIYSDVDHIVRKANIQTLVWIQMFRFKCLVVRFLPLKF